MLSSIKKTNDKNIQYQEFFDEIKKAEKIVCSWNYSSMYNKTILEVFILNSSKNDKTDHFFIKDFNYEILEALEKKGCHWDNIRDRMQGLSTLEELENDLNLKSALYADLDDYDYNDDSEQAIFQRIMDNLPDIDNYC